MASQQQNGRREAVAKDDRLYAPFDIGVDEHPKIIGLTDAAFRAFFEGVFYSRRSLSDGFLDRRIVLRKWGQEVADELSTNDPERPSWSAVENGWQIRDFEKHNPTRAEIGQKRAEVSEKRSAAGKKSGEVRRANAEQAANKIEQDANTTATNANPETETETETTPSNEGVPRKRGHRIPDDFTVTADMVAWSREKAPAVDGKRATEMFINYWQSASGRTATKTDWSKAWRNWLLSDQQRAEDRGWKPNDRSERKVFTPHDD